MQLRTVSLFMSYLPAVETFPFGFEGVQFRSGELILVRTSLGFIPLPILRSIIRCSGVLWLIILRSGVLRTDGIGLDLFGFILTRLLFRLLGFVGLVSTGPVLEPGPFPFWFTRALQLSFPVIPNDPIPFIPHFLASFGDSDDARKSINLGVDFL